MVPRITQKHAAHIPENGSDFRHGLILAGNVRIAPQARPKEKAPILHGRIEAWKREALLRRKVLVVVKIHNVLEHWRPRRQIFRIKEFPVEKEIPVWRAINQTATLECPGCIL